ncbi:MAG: RluA family pseudouridine synthase [Arcanobacterium sp.]|nr:RluA family pseudouridine synthase [Arcanobacterium sp.]
MFNSYPVPPDFLGERVDSLLSRFTGVSRAKCSELINSGKVLFNGEIVAKPAMKLQQPGLLEVELPPSPSVEPVPTPVADLTTIYEDEDLIVVNKPNGVAAHPSLNFVGPDVLGALLASGIRLTTSGPPERKGIVHRLDVGTTGCMVVAKSELAYTGLKRAFKNRTVTKIYHALVAGHPDPFSGTIDAPIGRDNRYQWKMAVRPEGKPAITHYDVVEVLPSAALLEVHLETGRTHQIRVHMAAINHPCIGDETYGRDQALADRLGLTRQWLHAVRLGFQHPRTLEYLEFTSPYPEDLQSALDQLRLS